MTPLRLSHTWHRRFYVAIFLLALSIVAIFAFGTFTDYTVADSLSVGLVPAIFAGLAALASGLFFFLERRLSSPLYSLVVFSLLVVATGWQMLLTGGIHSPYLLLWTLVSLFAALFGAYVWVAMIILVGAYISWAYLADQLHLETLITIVLGSIIPLLAGILVWREPAEAEDLAKDTKTLANELSEVASKSEIVINAIGDGVMAIDATGIIQLINPAAQQILGWGKQDALMLSYKSILKLENEKGEELDPALDPIKQVLNTNQQSRASDLTTATRSGKKISVAFVVTPIGDAGNGVIIVFRDITKERAEEREQAEFISTASHEMRTPVAAIEGYLGLAMNPNTATVDARAKDFIAKAHEAAQHLGRLFQDLLDVSKSEDGRMLNVPKVVDIVTLTDTIVQGLSQKAKDKGLTLTFNTTNNSSIQKKIMPVYYVNLDNDHIREILDNLIENAIKYTPAGDVIVDVNGSEDKVTISIKDSGLGIPTEDIPHLFQKFYRVSNKDRQEIGGTGLGLYLCRRLVEDMQGRIWVESVFGKGSTFFVELPRVETQEAEKLKHEQANVLQKPAMPVAPAAPAIPTTTPSISAPVSTGPPVAAPAPNVIAVATPANLAPTAAPAARPATSVPRGETLTRDQINERVKQLEALAKQQRRPTER